MRQLRVLEIVPADDFPKKSLPISLLVPFPPAIFTLLVNGLTSAASLVGEGKKPEVQGAPLLRKDAGAPLCPQRGTQPLHGAYKVRGFVFSLIPYPPFRSRRG